MANKNGKRNTSLRGGLKSRRGNLISNSRANVSRLLRRFTPRNDARQNISIILAPFSIGGPNNEAKDGPQALMSNHLDDDLRELGFNVKVIKPARDLMNYVSNHKQSNKKNRIKNIEAIVKINEWLAKTVENEIKSNSLPLTIGGDHSLAIGTIAGVVAGFSAVGRPALGKKPTTTKDIGVLWIDRHFDAHSPKNTPSWRAHGMPTAVAIADKKYDSHPDFQRLLMVGQSKKLPKVKPENLVHFAIGEKSLVKPKTKWFLMEDIDDYGITKCIEEAVNYLLKRTKKIYIAWDIDSMNVTGTGTSGDSQLVLREGLVIARTINKKIRLAGKLAGLELMEVAPKLERKDLKGQTVDWSMQLLTTCFGSNLFNLHSHMTRNINMHATDS